MLLKRFNLSYLLFLISIYGLIFQNLLQSKIPFFQYFDELLALSVIPLFILKILKNKYKREELLDKSEKKLIWLLVILLIIGLLSNLNNNFQSFKVIISDCVVFYKFYMVYFLTGIFWGNEFWDKYEKHIRKHLAFIVILLTFLTIGNYFFDLFPGDIRFGIKSNKLFYTHPTYLAAVCLFLLCLFIKIDKKIFNKYSVICILLFISTLRFKAIGSLIAIIITMLYINKTNNKISLTKFAVIGVIIFVFAYDQINYYFFQNDGFARKELMVTSFSIAKDYFPFGSGFATYGSFYSSVEYSPLYAMYGISNVYGIQRSNPAFIADTFWAMIIGQFGFIGLVIYILCIYYLYRIIQSINFSTSNGKYLYIAKLIALIYIVICSTSESAFAGPMVIPLAIVIGIKNIGKESEE